MNNYIQNIKKKNLFAVFAYLSLKLDKKLGLSIYFQINEL